MNAGVERQRAVGLHQNLHISTEGMLGVCVCVCMYVYACSCVFERVVTVPCSSAPQADQEAAPAWDAGVERQFAVLSSNTCTFIRGQQRSNVYVACVHVCVWCVSSVQVWVRRMGVRLWGCAGVRVYVGSSGGVGCRRAGGSPSNIVTSCRF